MFPTVSRPEKELKGFSKDLILAGETKKVTLKLNYRSFAFFSPVLDKWHVENGDFEIMIGSSVSDIKLKARIQLELDEKDQFSQI